MYNPSRGGVRGGADQFTWESVKTDKHRENYLGHSLKAPVGRWQKGKDLSWYAKERKDTEEAKNADKSELAAIKRAEQEAMLIALGHNIIRKENQSLSKEEMKEALKRNVGDRDQLNIERVDGVGAKSGRAALLIGNRSRNDSVAFETHKAKAAVDEGSKEFTLLKRSKNKKKSKKHKKEKKKKSHSKSDSVDSEYEQLSGKEYGKNKTKTDHYRKDFEEELSYKYHHQKEKKIKRRHDSSDSDGCQGESSSKRKKRNLQLKKRHDTEESNDSEDESTHRHKQIKEKHRRHDTSDSDELSSSDFNKRLKKNKLNKIHYDITRDEFDKQCKNRKEYQISKRGSDSKSTKLSNQNSENSYFENRKEKYRGQEKEIRTKRH